MSNEIKLIYIWTIFGKMRAKFGKLLDFSGLTLGDKNETWK